jgi:hypothetical protein
MVSSQASVSGRGIVRTEQSTPQFLTNEGGQYFPLFQLEQLKQL